MRLQGLASLLVHRVQLHETLHQSRPAGQDTIQRQTSTPHQMPVCRRGVQIIRCEQSLAGPARLATGSCMKQPAAAHGPPALG